MARWLFKTEPGDYSYDDLERDGRTRWEGVRNATALLHLREVRRGDEILVYHTGKEKQIVGLARATSDADADPAGAGGRQVVVDLEPVRRLARPVALTALRGDPAFEAFDLLRISRLSVMPVPATIWRRLLRLAT